MAVSGSNESEVTNEVTMYRVMGLTAGQSNERLYV